MAPIAHIQAHIPHPRLVRPEGRRGVPFYGRLFSSYMFTSSRAFALCLYVLFSLMIDYLSDKVIRGCGSKRCVVYDYIIIICLIVARHLHSENILCRYPHQMT